MAIAALVLLIMVIVALLLFAIRIKGAQQQQLQSQVAMQADLRALCHSAVQVGERVNRMEAELKGLQQRQQELGVRQDNLSHSEPLEAGFEQAIRLARKGSSVEELMEICNLSRGEAELIAMMHRLEPGG
jgi:predicted Holliday junction resolvase-like endonuclease